MLSVRAGDHGQVVLVLGEVETTVTWVDAVHLGAELTRQGVVCAAWAGIDLEVVEAVLGQARITGLESARAGSLEGLGR